MFSIVSATFRHYTCSQGVFQAGQHGLALWISMLLTVFDRCCGNLTAGYFTKGWEGLTASFALRFCKRLIQPWLMTQCRRVFWGHKKSRTVGHAFVQFFLTWCLEMRWVCFNVADITWCRNSCKCVLLAKPQSLHMFFLSCTHILLRQRLYPNHCRTNCIRTTQLKIAWTNRPLQQVTPPNRGGHGAGRSV